MSNILDAFKEKQVEEKTYTGKKIKVGIIGCGWIAEAHIAKYKEMEDVEIVAMHQVGTVVTLPDDKGDFMVKVGIMKLKTNLKDVRKKKDENATKTKKSKSTGVTGTISKTMRLSSEVDVRGETVDTAVVIIDKFLDDALMSSLSQVRIIHGKGTGQLRAGIHSYLKRLSYVKSYRLGTFGEGDSGVTVVEFK